MLNYDEFNDEMKKYINIAMNIYNSIANNVLESSVLFAGKRSHYELTKEDKKILSFFIAAFYLDGSIKEIFDDFGDIKKKDALEFVDLKEEDIKNISESERKKFFDSSIKLNLYKLIKRVDSLNKVTEVNPSIIIYSLFCGDTLDFDPINKFIEKYTQNHSFMGHPIKRSLEGHCLIEGYMVERKRGNRHIEDGPDDLEYKFLNFDEEPEESIVERKPQKTFKIDEKTWELLEQIKRKFIGQEKAAEAIFYNIIHNQELASKDEVIPGTRSIMFVDGPTGTGKTAILRELTDSLNIPYVSTSVTKYSASGYKGSDIEDILRNLYSKSGKNLGKAQSGIVVLDEFDKLSADLSMREAVQEDLLDFLGGGKYSINVGTSIFDSKEIEFDTSKLTFICLGALTSIREKKIDGDKSIGFISGNSGHESTYSISHQDLIDAGLKRELVGRLNTLLHTEDYSIESLERILRESEISPFKGLVALVESKGKTLEYEDDIYYVIAKQAYNINTGARSLEAIINTIRSYLLKEIYRGQDKAIKLDNSLIESICSDLTVRKKRG